MSSRTGAPPAHTANTKRANLKRLLWLTPIAAFAAIGVNLLVRAIARGVFDDISDDFQPFSAQAIVFWSIIGTIAAAAVFVLVARSSPHPIERYRTIAIVALVLSLIPDVLLWITKPEGVPGVTGSAIAALMVMHVVVAAICVGLFTTFSQER